MVYFRPLSGFFKRRKFLGFVSCSTWPLSNLRANVPFLFAFSIVAARQSEVELTLLSTLVPSFISSFGGSTIALISPAKNCDRHTQ